MELKDLPIETLDLILGYLFEYANETEQDVDEQNPEHLANARLVCRQWDKLASRHLFPSIRLRHGSQGFNDWSSMIDNDMVRSSVKEVQIESTPLPFEDRQDHCDWDLWVDEGEYPEFTDALDRIGELKKLKALVLHFGRECRTGDYEYDRERGECVSARERALTATFDAIVKRANKSPDGAFAIKSLTIENLQNFILGEFTASENFRRVMQDLTSLNLIVAEELNTLDGEVERDLHRPERRNFEPHLRKVWLDPIADQLTSLSLLFHYNWGVFPGKFDTNGLNFPQLRVLHLGSYVIARRNQFDWVLRHENLQTLRLENCVIASHLQIGAGNRRLWDVPDTDWVSHPKGAFGFNREDDEVYTFDETWENVLDSIRVSLPNLVGFHFHVCPHSFCLFRTDLMRTDEGYFDRYATFDAGNAQGWDGAGFFGFNDPQSIAGDPRATYRTRHIIDREEETFDGDTQALRALIEATKMNAFRQ